MLLNTDESSLSSNSSINYISLPFEGAETPGVDIENGATEEGSDDDDEGDNDRFHFAPRRRRRRSHGWTRLTFFGDGDDETEAGVDNAAGVEMETMERGCGEEWAVVVHAGDVSGRVSYARSGAGVGVQSVVEEGAIGGESRISMESDGRGEAEGLSAEGGEFGSKNTVEVESLEKTLTGDGGKMAGGEGAKMEGDKGDGSNGSEVDKTLVTGVSVAHRVAIETQVLGIVGESVVEGVKAEMLVPMVTAESEVGEEGEHKKGGGEEVGEEETTL